MGTIGVKKQNRECRATKTAIPVSKERRREQWMNLNSASQRTSSAAGAEETHVVKKHLTIHTPTHHILYEQQHETNALFHSAFAPASFPIFIQ